MIDELEQWAQATRERDRDDGKWTRGAGSHAHEGNRRENADTQITFLAHKRAHLIL
jgi:hypothetical protein